MKRNLKRRMRTSRNFRLRYIRKFKRHLINTYDVTDREAQRWATKFVNANLRR